MVINGQRAGIALGNSGGSKNKHDASGSGNWVHSKNLIGSSQVILVILGTPNTLIENNRITAREDSNTGIEVRNAPDTELPGNHITGGSDEFWAIHLSKDHGTDGRGGGIPSGIKIEGTSFDKPPTELGLMRGKTSAWMIIPWMASPGTS